jgi:hypothetical protein
MAAAKGTMPPNAGKGRRAGIPNRRTQVVADMLAEMECDPTLFARLHDFHLYAA